ncbi:MULTISPECIES: GntR family transcriptional regulator [Streptomyces]|uniref:GntR family transcriptional regulator n=1 Tax=Streptomyces evansiae TaxID=3075535 RepID=A0ABU2R5I9_9ACTN|nr:MULTISPECIES: GntR family transcriptional regulator [unclassified Streptomyces]MDT0411953.1 GntR family transcriptional regulator [Streptomyces sp. DSM 41979]MYQ58937.1 UTRA domain-containing protein [Streptomyces sp. SID4926]SCE36869.1 transcriptional regulator, GntR family [Streptomyces sp. DfronAA-171]
MGRAHETGGRAVPQYARIAADLLRQIEDGTLPPGELLPSEAELMRTYNVSAGTVRKAMAEVRAGGRVETRHGKGSLVKKRPPVRQRSSDRFRRSHRTKGQAAYLAEAAQSGAVPGVRVLSVEHRAVPDDVAPLLRVAPGTEVLARRRLYLRDGVPVETATSFIPRDVADAIPQLRAENPGSGGIYARFEGAGHEFAEFVETLQARGATAAETEVLGLTPGTPVIHLVREAVTTLGRVIEVCDTVMAADQFVLTYRIPAVD